MSKLEKLIALKVIKEITFDDKVQYQISDDAYLCFNDNGKLERCIEIFNKEGKISLFFDELPEQDLESCDFLVYGFEL